MTSRSPYLKRDKSPTPLTIAVTNLKTQNTWEQLSELLGVPASTLRHWTYFPPRRVGRSVRGAMARLEAAGILGAACPS